MLIFAGMSNDIEELVKEKLELSLASVLNLRMIRLLFQQMCSIIIFFQQIKKDYLVVLSFFGNRYPVRIQNNYSLI